MFKSKTVRAFTLIELLIVIAIIGILSVALVPVGMKALQKGRDATRISHVDTIVKAVKEYFIDGGSPIGLGGYSSGTRVILGNPSIPPSTSFAKYLPPNLPKDPSGTHSFIDETNPGAKGDYIVVMFSGNNEFAVCSYVEVPGNANVKKVISGSPSQPWFFINVSPVEFSKDNDPKVNYYCVKQKAA